MTYQYRIIANFFIIAQVPQGTWALLILVRLQQMLNTWYLAEGGQGNALDRMRILGLADGQDFFI